MGRFLALSYGIVCYALFLVTFIQAIWFVRTLHQDQAAADAWIPAVLIDLALLSLFAIQHSIMARQWFKRLWTKIVPPPVERSTFVLATVIILQLMYRLWQPLPGIIWDTQSATLRIVLEGGMWFGFGIVLIATFLIDHFDLFGLKQVWLYFRDKPYEPPKFRTPMLYSMVRHPLYLGFIIAFWCTPTMTADHLLFAVMTTAYMLAAVHLEERDLISYHGEEYKIYRSGVSMIVPWPKSRAGK
jgi:protein-S-isoprenylcysteine O-methyltransferase Ste14